MINTSLQSGLRNQLFQYAAAKALAERHSAKLKLDLTWHQLYSSRKYQLDHFNISANPASEKEIMKFTGNSLHLPVQKLHEWVTGRNRRVLRYKKPGFGFDPSMLNCGSDKWIDGYWQSERYFCGIAPIIMKEFTLATPLSEKSHEVYNNIMNTESVAVHIHRGNYVVQYAKKHNNP